MKFLVVGFLLLFASEGFAQASEAYCNSRYSYCVRVPSDFQAQGESDNGDGQRFLSSDAAAEIRVFAVLDEGQTLENLYRITSQQFKRDGGSVTYSVVRRDWMVISGHQDRGAQVYYLKVIRSGDRLISMIMTYPTAMKRVLDEDLVAVAKSLRPIQ